MSKRRTLSPTAALASLVLALPSGLAAQAQSAGQVSRLIPTVNLQRGTRVQPAAAGAKVQWGDVVTTDRQGRARITLDDGSILNVGSDSSLRIVQHDAANQRTQLQLAYGRVRSSAVHLAHPGASFEVRTPTAVAGVVGTDFVVEFSNGVTVTFVFEDSVNFCNLAGQCVTVNAGFTSTVRGNEPPTQPVPTPPSVATAAMQNTSVGGAAGQPNVQDRTITVQLKQNGQAQGGVSIYTLAGGNKFSSSTPAVAVTNNSGNASVLLSGLLAPDKPHTKLEIYVQVCVDGKKQVFVIPVGSENLLPEDTHDCHKYRVGYIWFDGGGNAVFEIGQNPGVTQTGGGGLAIAGGATPFISTLIGVGVGVKNLGGTGGDMKASMAAFPGANLNNTANSVAPELVSTVEIGYGMVSARLWRASDESFRVTAPILGGNDNFISTHQPQGFLLTGGPSLPLPWGVSVSLGGGLNVSRDNLRRVENVSTGAVSTMSSNSQHINYVGYTAGGNVRLNLGRRGQVMVGYDYIPISKGPVDIHLHEVSIAIMFRITGARPAGK